MVEIGYALSSEEHPPRNLVRFARGSWILLRSHLRSLPSVDQQTGQARGSSAFSDETKKGCVGFDQFDRYI
jgi:hypothetical protein